jgi:carbon monoxide dehydrogenase subunit G
MIIENSFSVAAPRSEVVAYFLDAERALACVPGVTGVSKDAEHAYTATLTAKVGPIKATFAGSVTYDPGNAPETVRATGEGRDRASGTMAKVTLDASFSEPESGQTQVTTRADLAIRGRLGQFGTGVIQAIADEMIGSFARCLETSITTGAAPDPTAVGGTRGPGLIGAAARGLVRGTASKLGGRPGQDDQASR